MDCRYVGRYVGVDCIQLAQDSPVMGFVNMASTFEFREAGNYFDHTNYKRSKKDPRRPMMGKFAVYFTMLSANQTVQFGT
jgi:hypothetical protein